jgi:argininosuccinate synthase
MSERVVLAYSGGLRSSVAIGRLVEETGAEVVAVAVDFGQRGVDPEATRRRALACGAVDAVVVDARDEFATDHCLAALRANALGQAGEALARPAVVEHLVRAVERHGATAVACPVGFAAGIGALAPDLPVHGFDWTREQAVRWAEERALPVDVTGSSSYSLDRTAWGRVVETAFGLGQPDPYDPDEVVVTFDHGVPVALDGETVTALQLVEELNRRAGEHGVGRLVGFDAPAAVTLITAHRALEDVTLDRDTARFKRTADRRWADLVHDGLWSSPLKDALDAFIETTQEHVSGEVRMFLHDGRAVVVGCRVDDPPHDFTLTPRTEGDTVFWLRGLPSKIAAKRI